MEKIRVKGEFDKNWVVQEGAALVLWGQYISERSGKEGPPLRVREISLSDLQEIIIPPAKPAEIDAAQKELERRRFVSFLPKKIGGYIINFRGEIEDPHGNYVATIPTMPRSELLAWFRDNNIV